MLLLQADHVSKSFGDRLLFAFDRLEIHRGDRIGLVGANGAGKSTLLAVLRGDEPADTGRIDRRCAIAMARQSGEADGTADGPSLRLLSPGGGRKSGGERTRYALAAAFSQDAPLLFADEPTTNLDLDGIEQLQKLLLDSRSAVVLISHDRALLDRFCTSIWAIENSGLRVYPGGYSDYLAQRNRERAFEQFEYEQYCAEKSRLQQEVYSRREQTRAMRKAPKRMGNSEARLHKGKAAEQQGQLAKRAGVLAKRLERLEEKQRPANLPQVRMALGSASPVTARRAACIEGLTVRCGTRTVLQNASFELLTGTRTVMLGANGAGKTTLLEHLMRGGAHARFAGGVKAGYFSQNHDVLEPDKTVLENARDGSPLAEHEVRAILANLGLADGDVFKPARVLSGGERAKAAFARLLASDCNLLVLDEPTNHLDLYALEALERLLTRWQGTLLVVTHDRRLTERLAQRLLFVENGGVRTFDGSWADWQAELARRAAPRGSGLDDLIDRMRRAAEPPKLF